MTTDTLDDILDTDALASVPAKAAHKPVGAGFGWLLHLLFWGGLVLALSALVALMVMSLSDPTAVYFLVSGMVVIFAFSTVGIVFRDRLSRIQPAAVEGVDEAIAPDRGLEGTLKALDLGEKLLASDRAARLVTRRDGSVVYANPAYRQLAREAMITGPSDLPPRIERLFAHQDAEAMKIFRLSRAARSGTPANEELYQLIGLGGDARRRRFDISVAPVSGDTDYVSWTLTELPAEDEVHDTLASSFADYLRPVFALERSGQIAWVNRAMRARLGAPRGGIMHIDDVVLGETGSLVETLWTDGHGPQVARVRRFSEGPVDARFQGFCHGGVGEGFVCVELEIIEEEEVQETTALAGEIADAPFGVAIVDGEFGRGAKVIESNRAFNDAFGASKSRSSVSKLFPTETIGELARELKRKAGGSGRVIEVRLGDEQNGRVYALSVKPVSRRRGSYGTRRVLLFSIEITDRKRMELDHSQDQKLKAIGNLAGEVAHDFNNFLQTILGNCELLLMNHPVGDPSYNQLVVIRENGHRLANLTKQLLAFSRKQTMQKKVLSITELLRDFTKFLDRAVGDKVKLDLDNGRGIRPVRADKNQLESAIMNLAVNARDAMGANGGTLTIRTRHVPASEVEERDLPGLAHVDHVMIEVSDTGPGVPVEIAGKIFDPFFTTKDVGKGTGLGLSTVHGVIGQMGGAIFLQSTPGTGASFQIYLPAYEGEMETAPEPLPATAESADLTGKGRVLVVEDEDSVRGFVVTTLRGRGYKVEEACDGTDALEVLEEKGAAEFDLIISDVMMHEMDGPIFVREAREQYSHHPRVVFMSGYAESAMRDQIDEIDDAGYLQKPFTAKALASCVKDIIGAPPGKGDSLQ